MLSFGGCLRDLSAVDLFCNMQSETVAPASSVKAHHDAFEAAAFCKSHSSSNFSGAVKRALQHRVQAYSNAGTVM